MTKLLLLGFAVIAVAMVAFVSCKPKQEAPKVLVLYFSQTSNTKGVAQEIATRLNADITRTTDGQSVELEQALTYLGIPLQASYLIWGYRRFSVYVSAGALVEKMVDGKRTMQGRKEKVSIHPLQVSLNSAVGAEYRFVDWLSLFAEPGLSYSFDNGSSIPTIYQETPLNFNLNLGFRFNIK